MSRSLHHTPDGCRVRSDRPRPAASPRVVAPPRFHPMLGLQESAGNRAVGRLLQHTPPYDGGEPLHAGVRRSLEAAYHTDLGHVRLHRDASAADAAHELGAKAFTLGNDIWFGRGQYRPELPQSQYLLAHEVAHTLQQRGSGRAIQRSAPVGSPHDPAEVLADRAAEAAMKGVSVPPVGTSEAVVRRYSITRAEPVIEGGETVVYVDLDTGIRYRVRRVRSVRWEEGRPGSFLPPSVTPGSDANDVWIQVSWCTGTRGSVRGGADIPAALRATINRLITAATTGGSGVAALGASALTPFVDFAVAQSGGVDVSGEVHVVVGRTGATGGGGTLTASRGEWSGSIGAETGAGGTTVMFTLTFTPGLRSEQFSCPRGDPVKGRFITSTAYECTHESTRPPPAQPPPEPASEAVAIYFDYSTDHIREGASRGGLDHLRKLLGRGYRVTGVDGFTSPEGPVPPARRFEGNERLGAERATAAAARIRNLGGEVSVPPMGHGELYSPGGGAGSAGGEVEGAPLATHAVSEFRARPEEMARLTDADRRRLTAARTPAAQADVVYPYLRRAVITLTGPSTTPSISAPRQLDLSLGPDYYYCPPDVLDRARPLFDRATPGAGTP
jgi:uncharacterized protein DUF4157